MNLGVTAVATVGGAFIGAEIGAFGGPIGIVIGGAIGYSLSKLFSWWWTKDQFDENSFD